MSSTSTAHTLSPKSLLVLGISLLLLASEANAWLLEFWSDQADCNYKKTDIGTNVSADTSRGGPDHMSNNCMSMSYDPDTYGLVAMRVTGWTGDCAIAFWSDSPGSVPCQAEVPFGLDDDSQPPDYVLTLKSRQVTTATDEDGNTYECISPLYEYVKSNSGFLGYVAYSCGQNGTILLDEFEKHYDGDQIESVIKSLTATSESASKTTSRDISSTLTTHLSHNHTGTAVAGNSSIAYATLNKLRIGLPPRPTTLMGRGTQH
ncbi:hypothetical protein GGR55DRAFT_695986 [Xylaria sp. FL0064]|nr:hypothetical protein GGR55DRAFT_695986 [Xylaria sp. FL0064]